VILGSVSSMNSHPEETGCNVGTLYGSCSESGIDADVKVELSSG